MVGPCCKTATCIEKEVFLQRSLVPRTRPGRTTTAEVKACCSMLSPPDLKPWWQKCDLQEPVLGSGCWGLSPTDRTLRFPYTGMAWEPHGQIDTVTVLQREGGVAGIALPAECVKAMFLWMPEHRLYGFLPCNEGQTV